MATLNPAVNISLSKLEPFCKLAAAERELLESSCRIIDVPARDFIFMEGDTPSAGYCVLTGRVVMLKSSRNGKELIVQLLPPGELFGLVAFLDSKPFPLSARAQSDSTVIVIPANVVAPLLRKHPELTRSFAELVAQRMRETQDLARALAHDRIEARIASVLLSLIPRISESTNGHTINIPLGRQELADVVGTTIETASRIMKAFEREQIVDLSRSGVVTLLSKKPLLEIVNESPIP